MTVTDSGDATAVRGGVAVSGAVLGDVRAEYHEHYTTIIHLDTHSPGRPAEDSYRMQLQRIAPPSLRDRDNELRELADFCLHEERGPYAWWQGGPWAGKSALMSTLVLDPPADLVGQVSFVSFFITAQLADQSTRDDFIQVLSEQLCALIRQNVPPAVASALRDQRLLRLLNQAAVTCRAAGRRLVLVVDGLDEDRRDSHSIAALLPPDPPAGMRIIVAGRPDPPLPDDVPAWHPLRDPAVVRRLTDSPHAQDVQRRSKVELTSLTQGGGLSEAVVGLITAARGGLSAEDLRELTGARLVEIEGLLHTVSGRTFASRATTWSHGGGTDTYLLGHEQLDAAAVYYLGEKVLDGYRNRLHAWAAGHRPGWPDTTPEYLLRGYPRLLREIGDTTRLVDLATDRARLDRMRRRTGGDEAIVVELTMVHDYLAEQPEPDMLGMGRLSICTYEIRTRNSSIPTGLPAVWATLGYPERAQALALGFTVPYRRAFALAALAEEAARRGDLPQAERLARWSEEITRSLSTPSLRARGLAALVGAVARTGPLDAAERLANEVVRTAPGTTFAGRSTEVIVTALAEASQAEIAVRVAGHILEPEKRAIALATVARAVAHAGELEQASRVAADACLIAKRAESSYGRDKALVEVALSMVEAGQPEPAEQLARSLESHPHAGRILASVALSAARAGQGRRAARLADEAMQLAASLYPRPEGPDIPIFAMSAEAMALLGRLDRAAELFADVEQRTPKNGWGHSREIAEAAESAARAGRCDLARRLAALVYPDEHGRLAYAELVRALMRDDPARAVELGATIAEKHMDLSVTIADQLARAGHRPQAAQLLDHVEQVARSVRDRGWEDVTLSDVASAVARSGDPHRAESLARAVSDPGWRASALVPVAEAFEAAGNPQHAGRVAAEAEEMARATPHRGSSALIKLAALAAQTGQPDRALAIARIIDDPLERARALEAAMATGETKIVVEIEQLARSTPDPNRRADILMILARALVAADESERGEQIAREIPKPGKRVCALAAVAGAMARAGRSEQARALALGAEQLLSQLAQHDDLTRVAADVVGALARAGETGRAERLARAIPDDLSFERASALASIVEVVGLPEGHHLLAEMFALGRWVHAIRLLATLRPELVTPIADAAYPYV